MANFTAEQATACNIVKAVYNDGWRVTVKDADGIAYSIKVSGADNVSDATLSENIYNKLLVTKKRTVDGSPDAPVSRDEVRGTKPATR